MNHTGRLSVVETELKSIKESTTTLHGKVDLLTTEVNDIKVQLATLKGTFKGVGWIVGIVGTIIGILGTWQP